MYLIRFFFYAIITYFILKLVRVFTDPLTQNQKRANVPPSNSTPNPSPNTKQNKPTLGDYVDFEEIKS